MSIAGGAGLRSEPFALPRSELELWHPRGAAGRRLGVGELALEMNDGTDEVDLAVVAPGPRQATRRWLREAVAGAARRLATDGLVWIAVDRGHRGQAERALHRAGLTIRGAVVTVPPPPGSRHMVGLEPAPLRDAAARHLGLPRPAGGLLAGLALTSAGRMALRRAAPGCALLAGRTGDASPLHWLGGLDAGARVQASVSIGARPDTRVATVLRFTPDGRAPDLAVKVALDEAGAARLEAERGALERLGPAAAGAGARLPSPGPGPRPWLTMGPVLSGEPAAVAVSRHPRRLGAIMGRLADWLLAWNRATVAGESAEPPGLARLVSEPLERLVAGGVATEAYAEALRGLVAAVLGQPLMAAAAHNDLTFDNVLDDPAGVGILDWEDATESGLPLADLWYALADGVARAARTTHAAAVDAILAHRAPGAPALSRLPDRHAAALDLPPDQSLLAFHACWIAHADDELERGAGEGRFTAVLRMVATRRLLWPAAG